MDFLLLESISQIIANGVMIGCIFGLMCVGLALIFGVLHITNFAQGEFLMLGMYGSLFIATVLGIQYVGILSPFIAAILATPVLFLLGAFVYRLVLARISESQKSLGDAQHGAQLLITLGISLVLQNAALIVFGSEPRATATPLASSAWPLPLPFGEDLMLFLNKAKSISAVIAVGAVLLLFYLINHTRLGRSVRAAADDVNAAQFCGISIRKVYTVTFGLGVAVTGLAGGLAATFYSFQPYVGFEFVIFMYAGVILGGLGSIYGAFWGGFVVGLVQQLSSLVMPLQLQNFTIFVAFLIFLIARPQGFLGRSVERT
jgi:branched-chain amino acid transport system permease protein